MKLKRILLGVVVLAAVAALAWGGVTLLRRRNAAETASMVTSYTVAVERGDLIASITPTGEVYAPRSAELTVDVTRLPVIEVDVVAGEQVQQGQVLVRIDPTSLQRAVDQAKATLLSAEDGLNMARNPYTRLDQQQAAVAVAQAETGLEEARESLDDLRSPDVDTAREVVADAARTLAEAQQELADLREDTSTQKTIDALQYTADEATVAHGALLAKNDTSEKGLDSLLLAYNAMMDAHEALESARLQAQLSLLAAENQAAEAQDALADAREALADAQNGPTALELAQAENQVALAQYNLTRARQDQAAILAGPDQSDLQVAQAAYGAAQAALEEAEATLAAAAVVAPFDGTVVSVGVEVGDLVSTGTVIATLADLTELRVRATVDETDISQVQIGQDVQVTFDAFTGYTFQGRVLEVPLQGTLSQSVVTYEVPISLEGTEGVGIRSGMTANLAIITGESQDALLIPALAVQQGDSGDVVVVQNPDGTQAETPVEIGLGNETYVQVLRGLNEGDQVVVTYDTSTEEEPFGFGAGFAVEMRGEGAPPPDAMPLP